MISPSSCRSAALAFLALTFGVTAAVAQQAPVVPAPPIRIIIEVPNDEAGRSFVTDKVVPKLGGTVQTVTPAPTAAGTQPAANAGADAMDVPMMAAAELSTLRNRAAILVREIPRVPEEIRAGIDRFASMSDTPNIWLLLGALLLFVGGGLAARNLTFWASRGLLNRILEAPGDTARDRVRILGMRLSLSLLVLVASMIGSIGAFLLFPWPPVFRETLLTLLLVFVMRGLAILFGRIVIAPGARHDYFRVLPISTPLAWFWYHWLVSTVMVGASLWAVVSIMGIVGIDRMAREIMASGAFAIVAGMAVTAIWQRINKPDEPPISRLAGVILTAALVLLWLSFTLRLPLVFWTVLAFTAAPLLTALVRMGVRNVVRLDSQAKGEDSMVLAWAVVVERALRVLIVLAAVSVLARAWGVDLGDIAMGETALTRVLRGGLRIIVVLLVADLAWRLIRALTDGRLDGGEPVPSHDETVEGRRRQRLRTLLPILRNFLLVLIASITVLMVLDALGIQIGPLLAGAGVVGIAIGFGAQTLVKDIISGVFYLLDDAFRVGEYIQAGSHKGTVESFSLRSIKLRHHRGPISTVPFGDLGAVQNMSRDWVIDKITIGVNYDTDLDLAKRIVKQIGKELITDPEFAPHIIETLKMQGVEEMGDYAIQLRLKMMTRPGEQFVIRRRAYALLKKAFAENGIRFALPTVQVAEGAEKAAVAQRAMDLLHPPLPAEGKA